jgi:hypothetical protein
MPFNYDPAMKQPGMLVVQAEPPDGSGQWLRPG